jgi:uncharacterized protein YneF (UPF0154 family)
MINIDFTVIIIIALIAMIIGIVIGAQISRPNVRG